MTYSAVRSLLGSPLSDTRMLTGTKILINSLSKLISVYSIPDSDYPTRKDVEKLTRQDNRRYGCSTFLGPRLGCIQ